MKIVFATSGTLGDHLPVISLARLLLSSGYDVVVAGNPNFKEIVQYQCIPFIPLGISLGEIEANNSATSWDQWLQLPPPFLPGDQNFIRVVSSIKALLCVLAKDDLLISARNVPCMSIVANITQCRWVEIGLNSVSMTDCIEHNLSQQKRSLSHYQYETFYESVRSHFAGRISSSLDPSPSARLHAVPPEFVPKDYPQVNCVTTGFWVSDSLHMRDWKPTIKLEKELEVSPKPLGIIFSSLPLFDPVVCLQKHIEIARLLKRSLVVVKGWSFGQAAQTKIPDLQRLMSDPRIIAIDPVPLSWLLPRIAAAFIHGGMGTLSESLKSGCMTLIEPYGNDQFLNARLAMESGLAKVIHPYRINPIEIANEMAVQFDRPRTRLQSAAFDGLQVALNRIHDIVRMG
jgi:UDP:flavonoid glycosyltransferase YjiC (YdhE family)